MPPRPEGVSVTIHRRVTPVTLTCISFIRFRTGRLGPCIRSVPGRAVSPANSSPCRPCWSLSSWRGARSSPMLTDRDQASETARSQVLAAARAVADSPSVRQAIRTSDPSALLQPYAEQVRRDTGVDFVTIMNPQGIRWTHPDPRQIGMPFLGRTAPALHGRDLHRDIHRHTRPVDARGHPGPGRRQDHRTGQRRHHGGPDLVPSGPPGQGAGPGRRASRCCSAASEPISSTPGCAGTPTE